MIKSKRFLPVLIISIIVIVCTTLVFGMSSNAKELIDWMAFLFIIIAEVICMLGIMFAGGERKAKALLNAGTITTLVIYFVVCLIISILFTLFFRDSVNILIIFQILLIALTFIVLTIIRIFAKKSNLE